MKGMHWAACAAIFLLAACGGDREQVEIRDVQTDTAPKPTTMSQDRAVRVEQATEEELAKILETLPPGSKIFRSTNADGSPQAQGFFCDKKPVGPWIYWHAKNIMAMKGSYRYGGKPHGKWLMWYADGSQMASGSYHFGKEHGPWRYWYANGRPSMKGEYHYGKRHGLWTFWHPGGVHAGQGKYIHGRTSGAWQYWDTSGSPTTTMLFHHPAKHRIPGAW